MNLAQLCKEIKSLIREILIADQELEQATEQATNTSESKAREAVTLLTEYIKEEEIAALYLKYNQINNRVSSQVITFKNQKQFNNNPYIVVWDRSHGLGMQPVSGQTNPNTIRKLVITEGNFPVEQLVQTIHSQLNNTFNKIKKQNNEITQTANQRIRELDKLIDCLKEID